MCTLLRQFTFNLVSVVLFYAKKGSGNIGSFT